MAPRFTLRQLTYFVAVVETGTLRAAAQRLNTSQSALSEGLSELERDLKATLLIRRKSQGVTLTNVGRDLLEMARSTLQNAQALQSHADGSKNTLTGIMTVGCYTTLAPFIIPPLIAELRRKHPELRVEIIEGAADDIQSQLHQGRCELAFLYNFDLLPGISYDPLYDIKPHVLLSGRHRLASRKSVDLKDIADEPLILFDLQPSRRNTQMIFNEVGVTPNISIRSQNFELVRSLVARGLGYSILIQRPPVKTSYEGHPVVERDIARTSALFSVTLAHVPSNAGSYRIEAVRDICRAQF